MIATPRDHLTFPFGAARWSLVAGAAGLVLSLGLTWSRFADQGMETGWMVELLLSHLGSGLLGMALAAVLVTLIAEHRQRRRPATVGHAPRAALATGVIASAVGMLAAWLPSTLIGFVTTLQSPAGFTVIAVLSSLGHLAGVAVGTLFGASLLPTEGDPAPVAAPRRLAIVGALVFFAVLGLGIDLALTLAPPLMEGPFGDQSLSVSQWSSLAALLTAGAVTTGYAWMRSGSNAPHAQWRGDVWAGLAALPLSLVVSVLTAFVAGVALYVLDDVHLPLVVGGIAVLLALGALALLGVAIGALRMRLARQG